MNTKPKIIKALKSGATLWYTSRFGYWSFWIRVLRSGASPETTTHLSDKACVALMTQLPASIQESDLLVPAKESAEGIHPISVKEFNIQRALGTLKKYRDYQIKFTWKEMDHSK